MEGYGQEKIETEAIFDMENKNLLYSREKEKLSENPSRRSLHHINMVQRAVHFWRTVLTPEKHLASVHYHASASSFSEFAPNTNVAVEFQNCRFEKPFSTKTTQQRALGAVLEFVPSRSLLSLWDTLSESSIGPESGGWILVLELVRPQRRTCLSRNTASSLDVKRIKKVFRR